MELEWDFRWPLRRLLSTALLIWKTGILLDGPLGAKGCFGETMFKWRRHIAYIGITFVFVVVSAFSFFHFFTFVYLFVFIFAFVFVFVFIFVFAVVYHWSPGSCDQCTSIPPLLLPAGWLLILNLFLQNKYHQRCFKRKKMQNGFEKKRPWEVEVAPHC